LEDMHDLLQQMKDMHGEYHVPDHCEGYFQDAKQWAYKKAGVESSEVKIENYFKNLKDDEQKSGLDSLMDITKNPKDIFNVLAKHILPDDLLRIVFPTDTIHDDRIRDSKKVEKAFSHFKDLDPEHQKDDLKKILAKMWGNKIDPVAVVKELVMQMAIRKEMINGWNVK